MLIHRLKITMLLHSVLSEIEYYCRTNNQEHLSHLESTNSARWDHYPRHPSKARAVRVAPADVHSPMTDQSKGTLLGRSGARLACMTPIFQLIPQIWAPNGSTTNAIKVFVGREKSHISWGTCQAGGTIVSVMQADWGKSCPTSLFSR